MRRRNLALLLACCAASACGSPSDQCSAGCPPGTVCYFGSCVTPEDAAGDGGEVGIEAREDAGPSEDAADAPRDDGRVEADGTPETGADADAGPDADADDDTGDVRPEAEEAADSPPVPVCGNGTVEPGEECDDPTPFCVACAHAAPAGWTDCTRADGRRVFLQVTPWPGDHLWTEYRDTCRDTIDALGRPPGTASYGLVTISDSAVRDCLLPLLDPAVQYWVGLYQHGGGAEPDGDWYWTGWDGSGWVDVAPLDPAAPGIPVVLDEWPADSDCIRLLYNVTEWQLCDYTCSPAAAFSGVCALVL